MSEPNSTEPEIQMPGKSRRLWFLIVAVGLGIMFIFPILIRGSKQRELIYRIRPEGSSVSLFEPRPVWLTQHLGADYQLAFGQIYEAQLLQDVSERDFAYLVEQRLRKLEFHDVELTEPKEDLLGQMQELEELSFLLSPPLSKAAMHQISRLDSLQTLIICNTMIEPDAMESLGGFSHLRTLDLM